MAPRSRTPGRSGGGRHSPAGQSRHAPRRHRRPGDHRREPSLPESAHPPIRLVAPWLLGRPVLLLSATPVVNRLDDLAHQLLLGVRDDALLAEGVVSLRTALAAGTGVFGAGAGRGRGHRQRGSTALAGLRGKCGEPGGRRSGRPSARAARAAQLSHHSPTAALVRGVLQRGIASSPAALAGALRRYRTLLLNARDAWQAGRALSRAELREFAGELDNQLVMWELLAQTGGGGRAGAGRSRRARGHGGGGRRRGRGRRSEGRTPAGDSSDGRPTLVFATRRETVRHLRDLLAPPPVAWCTGERAGLGVPRYPGRRAGLVPESQPNEAVASAAAWSRPMSRPRGSTCGERSGWSITICRGRRRGWSSAKGAPCGGLARTSGST